MKIKYHCDGGKLMDFLEKQIYQGKLNKIHDYEISNKNFYIIANRHCYSNKIEINIELFNRENNYYQVLSIRKNINSIEQINKIIDAFENLLKVLE